METLTSPIKIGESQINWYDMDETQQLQCISEHREGFKKAGILKDLDIFKRIFDVGNPAIIMGTHADGTQYCRIAPHSVVIMTILLNAYL